MIVNWELELESTYFLYMYVLIQCHFLKENFAFWKVLNNLKNHQKRHIKLK